jgi:FAD-dependent urate hydroxylase
MQGTRILIVGAGLAGLALARALRQAGLAPQVIEREAGWEVAGTGIYLPANGVRALRTLGLEGAVAARGAQIPRQRLLDHRGHLLADIDLQRLWGSVGPCLALPRTDLHEILREGVPVQLGRTIRSLENLDGQLAVVLAGVARVLPQLLAAYHTGGSVPYAAYRAGDAARHRRAQPADVPARARQYPRRA